MAASPTVSPLLVSQVNSLTDEEFIRVFGNVVERCALCAAAVTRCRPFRNLQHLYAEFCNFMDQLPTAGCEGILRSHPDLAGRAAQTGALTEESLREQRAAGMADLTAEERDLMNTLNNSYRRKFGFPFVVCARMNKKEAILQGLQTRLNNTADEELRTGILEVKKISLLRLRDLVTEEEEATYSRM